MSRSYRSLLMRCTQHFVTWPVTDLASDQKQKQQAKHKIEADEADQREHRIAAAHNLAVALGRTKQAVDQPGLTAQFGGHPSKRVGDVWKWECEHQHPEQPIGGLKSAPPALKRRVPHQQNEDRAKRDHEVKRVVEQLDVVGPL